MSAYIHVVGHPYAAISDQDGRFVIDQVPRGTYKIKMWHEGVSVVKTEIENGIVKKYIFEDPYEIEKEVSITENGDTEIVFDLEFR